jgi:hypothetical protein
MGAGEIAGTLQNRSMMTAPTAIHGMLTPAVSVPIMAMMGRMRLVEQRGGSAVGRWRVVSGRAGAQAITTPDPNEKEGENSTQEPDKP